MKDIQRLDDNYVIFLPRQFSLSTVYLRFQNVFIRFASNDISYLQKVYSSDDITLRLENESEAVASITVIIDENIFPRKYDYESYDDSVFTTKDHPMYMDNVYNEVIESEGIKVYKYHYPNQSLHIFNSVDNSVVSVVSNVKDAIKYLKFAIKQTLSEYLIKKSIYPIHGAAVSIQGRGFLFVSGSHTGKTTLYKNLICNGFLPINDDIVFWKCEGDRISMTGCPILPQERPYNRKDFIMSESYQKGSGDICRKVDRWSVLDSVFFLSLGGMRTSVNSIQKSGYIRRYLRACSIHHPIPVCESFLESFKKLVNVSAFHLELSKDYNEVCQSFNNFISRRMHV